MLLLYLITAETAVYLLLYWSKVKFEVQVQKLIAKWKEGREIPEAYRSKYAELAWLLEKRFLPYLWVKQGRVMMRSRHYLPGLMLHLKAIKPYLMSLLPFRAQ